MERMHTLGKRLALADDEDDSEDDSENDSETEDDEESEEAKNLSTPIEEPVAPFELTHTYGSNSCCCFQPIETKKAWRAIHARR